MAIKRKVVKAGVELRIKDKSGSFIHTGYFASKLEAQIFSQKYHRGLDFTIQNVRLDATPISRTKEGDDNRGSNHG